MVAQERPPDPRAAVHSFFVGAPSTTVTVVTVAISIYIYIYIYISLYIYIHIYIVFSAVPPDKCADYRGRQRQVSWGSPKTEARAISGGRTRHKDDHWRHS